MWIQVQYAYGRRWEMPWHHTIHGSDAKGDDVRDRVATMCSTIVEMCDEILDDTSKCPALMKLVGKLSRDVHPCNSKRFNALLHASAAFINSGCSKGEHSEATLTLIMEVVNALRTAPYSAHVDLAYQASIYGRVLLTIAKSPKSSQAERDVCLRLAQTVYKEAFKCLLTARGFEHPQTKILQKRIQSVKEMLAVAKKTGLIQAILDKRKAREVPEDSTNAAAKPTTDSESSSNAFLPVADGGVGLTRSCE